MLFARLLALSLLFQSSNPTISIRAGGSSTASGGVQGFATASLPTCGASSNVNVVAWDTTLQKLVVCDGTAWVTKVGTTVLYSNAVAHPTTTTSIETLDSYTLPAGFLDTNANTLNIELNFSCAANANVKTVTLTFGATTDVISNNQTCNGTGYWARALIWRRTATTQVSISTFSNSANSGGSRIKAPGETLSGTVAILVRGTTATAAGDLTLDSWRVVSER